MSYATSDAQRAYTDTFLSELQHLFETDTHWNHDMDWVAGRALSDDVAVVLYRDRADGPILGRRYVMSEQRALFSDNSAEAVAGESWTGDLVDPSGPGELRAVDWADGLCDAPRDVRWIGVTS